MGSSGRRRGPQNPAGTHSINFVRRDWLPTTIILEVTRLADELAVLRVDVRSWPFAPVTALNINVRFGVLNRSLGLARSQQLRQIWASPRGRFLVGATASAMG